MDSEDYEAVVAAVKKKRGKDRTFLSLDPSNLFASMALFHRIVFPADSRTSREYGAAYEEYPSVRKHME